MASLTQIFEKVAQFLGLSKPIYKQEDTRYEVDDNINLTAAIANRVATITMLDSDVTIKGDSERAKFLNDFLKEYVDDRMATAAEVALGTGDCLIKPWTDGTHVGVDIIDNNNFRVCDSVGNYLKSVIIRCDEMTIAGHTYQRFEGQRIENVDGVPTLFIDQMVYKDAELLTKHNDYPVAWKDLIDEDYISNCDQLLLGRYKCPTVKRDDVNSECGVSVTYGLDEPMAEAVAAYRRFNDEQRKKETMLFADKTLFKVDERGHRMLPRGKERIIQTVTGRDGGEMIHEWSPDLRTTQLKEGIDMNFRMLELLAGFSAGVLTSPTSNFATATEMKASLQSTYAFITKFRKQLVKGTNDLLGAVNIICNRNNITPYGEWEPAYDWSSQYIENMAEQYNRLVSAEAIGAVSKAEVRSWVMDEDLATAEEKVNEIEQAELV